MPRKCSVCGHEKRAEIDAAVLAGGSIRGIAEHFGLSATSLDRHARNHIPADLAKASAERDFARAGSLLDKVDALAAEVQTTLQEARRMKNHVLVLQSVDRAGKLIELQAKVAGTMGLRPVRFDLPPITSAEDAAKASAAIVAAVASGELAPAEAVEVGKVLGMHLRALEMSEFERRLAALEAEKTS